MLEDMTIVDYEGIVLQRRLEVIQSLRRRQIEQSIQICSLQSRVDMLEKRNRELELEIEKNLREAEEYREKMCLLEKQTTIQTEQIIDHLQRQENKEINNTSCPLRSKPRSPKTANQKPSLKTSTVFCDTIYDNVCGQINDTIRKTFLRGDDGLNSKDFDTFASKINDILRSGNKTKDAISNEFLLLCENFIFLLQKAPFTDQSFTEIKQSSPTRYTRSRSSTVLDAILKEQSPDEDTKNIIPTELLLFNLIGLIESICKTLPEAFISVVDMHRNINACWEPALNIRSLLPYIYRVISILYKELRNSYNKLGLLEKLLNDEVNFIKADNRQESLMSFRYIHSEWDCIRSNHLNISSGRESKVNLSSNDNSKLYS